MSLIGPFALAFVAGLVSISSPCCLPLMPGYVSYIGGVSSDAGQLTRSRTVTAAALFVLGFALVFTSLGAAASLAGGWLLEHRLLLERVGGVFVIVMGLATLGVVRIPVLYREARFGTRRIRPGLGGAFPLGAAFAIGWTPCVGPVLASILTAAASTQAVTRGASLLFVYSLGLGIPFLLLAVAYGTDVRWFRWLRIHARGVEIVGGVILLIMGVLMISGVWVLLFTPMLRWFAQSGWPPV